MGDTLALIGCCCAGAGGGDRGALIDMPESFLECLIGLEGAGGVRGTSVTVVETADLDEVDLRGLGRTMASCGVEALFRCTFRTTGWSFFPPLVLDRSVTSETDLQLGSFCLVLPSVLLCLLCLSLSFC